MVPLCSPFSGRDNEMRIRQLLQVNRGSSLTSAGLLVLRLFVGLGIFIKHGIEKLTGYSTMVHHFLSEAECGKSVSQRLAVEP